MSFLLFLYCFTAVSFETDGFEQKKFQTAQKNGEIILVDIYANWCSTCKKQGAEISELFKNEKYKNIKIFKLDYDDKNLVNNFSKLIDRPIPRQSTIVVFKGKIIISFSVAETGEKLKEAVDKAVLR